MEQSRVVAVPVRYHYHLVADPGAAVAARAPDRVPLPPRLRGGTVSRRRGAAAVAAAAGMAAVIAAAGPAAAGTGPTADRYGDEILIRGTRGSDQMTIGLAPDPGALAVDLDGDGLTDRTLALDGVQHIRADLAAGDDEWAVDDAHGTIPVAVHVSVDAGAGADRVFGGAGPETLLAGAGRDTVTGGGGTDTVVLGSGRDTVGWSPGDGNDIVDGGAGEDVATVRGDVSPERFEVAPAGDRVHVTRDADAVRLDLGGIERAELTMLEGDDSLVLRDLSGTDLDVVAADLAATGAGGDPGTDFLTVFATESGDDVEVRGASGTASVTGLAARLDVTGAVSPDVLQVLGLGGNDSIDASELPATTIGYGASGHDGDDRLVGGGAADSLDGGEGADVVSGGGGDDSMFTGPGDDTITWSPGDGSDLVGGEDGRDTLVFAGSDDAERFTVAADGFGGTVLTRDVGSIAMALDRVERVELAAARGADTVTIKDLGHFRGTGLEHVEVDLGPGHGVDDRLVVTGTEEDDSVDVTGAGSTARVTGLPAGVTVRSVRNGDLLTVLGLGGDDDIHVGPLLRSVFLAEGGDGADLFRGGHGDDVFRGGAGDDVAFGGRGDDVLRGNDGDDMLDGGAGRDTLIGDAGHDTLLNGEIVEDD